jgi:cysteinyl-tRNA synthetase
MRLYDSLTREVHEIVPVDASIVKIYSCGPTVYRYIHIGNMRSFMLGDLIRRALRFEGRDVRWIMNITDVGHMTDDVTDTGRDKMELAEADEGLSAAEIAEKYTKAFLEDADLVGIERADLYPLATQHIGEMIAIIERLIENGHAYEVNGTVYYDVTTFPAYGKLSGNTLDQLRAGHRQEVAVDPAKRHPEDFALWKHAGPNRQLKWPSPWGEGYPGWHIECSAMSMKHLGERFDIHTGGNDNKFPHHEDEIAQSEGALGHRVVSIWLHGEFLTLDDAKMAKSAGNIIRVTDLPQKGFEPLDFRYLALTAHYRSKLDFTQSAMQAAASGLRRLRRATSGETDAGAPAPDLSAEPMAAYQSRFAEAISDDLAMPRALAVAHEVAAADDLAPAQRRALLLDFDRVLGLDIDAPAEPESAALPEGAAELLERRAAARAAHDYVTSDALREELAGMGVEVRDTPDGQITRASR